MDNLPMFALPQKLNYFGLPITVVLLARSLFSAVLCGGRKKGLDLFSGAISPWLPKSLENVDVRNAL